MTRRRALLPNAVAMTVATAGYTLVALLGSPAGWLLVGAVPLTIVHWVRWHRARPARPVGPRPDYARIAELEHELLGIEPTPGTFAGAALALRAGFRSVNQDRARRGKEPGCGHVDVEHLLVEGGQTIRICWTCKALRAEREPIRDAPPLPPPGPGAGSPTFGSALTEHRRAMATLRELHADLEERRAEMERIGEQIASMPPLPRRPDR